MKETPTIEQGLGTLIITGSSGRIGSSFVDRVGVTYTEMGFDREGPPHPPPETEHVISCDLGSDESVWAALDEVRRLGHTRIASMLHFSREIQLRSLVSLLRGHLLNKFSRVPATGRQQQTPRVL